MVANAGPLTTCQAPKKAAVLAALPGQKVWRTPSAIEVASCPAAPVTPPAAERGYLKLFLDSVTQADEGVDFDFLRPPKR